MKQQLLSMLVSNHFGVLTRVTNLFSRRGFNIKELTVGETDDPKISRITILTEGDELMLSQIRKQLFKLEDVKKAVVLPAEDIISRELLLIKVHCDADTVQDLDRDLEEMGGKVLNLADDSALIEVTGEVDIIDACVQRMKKYGIMEMCRTGSTALQTGNKTIYNV